MAMLPISMLLRGVIHIGMFFLSLVLFTGGITYYGKLLGRDINNGMIHTEFIERTLVYNIKTDIPTVAEIWKNKNIPIYFRVWKCFSIWLVPRNPFLVPINLFLKWNIFRGKFQKKIVTFFDLPIFRDLIFGVYDKEFKETVSDSTKDTLLGFMDKRELDEKALDSLLPALCKAYSKLSKSNVTQDQVIDKYKELFNTISEHLYTAHLLFDPRSTLEKVGALSILYTIFIPLLIFCLFACVFLFSKYRRLQPPLRSN